MPLVSKIEHISLPAKIEITNGVRERFKKYCLLDEMAEDNRGESWPNPNCPLRFECDARWFTKREPACIHYTELLQETL